MTNLKGRDLKLGDVVFLDSRNVVDILAEAVRIMENGGTSPKDRFVPNHCGIVIEEHEDINQVQIIQSQCIGGVAIKPLYLWLESPKTNMIVKRYKNEFPDYKKRQMKTWLKNKIGLPYDVLSTFGILLAYVIYQSLNNKILKYFIKHIPNPLDSKFRIICSELVYMAFLEILGVSIWVDCHASYVSPYDEYRSKDFRTTGYYFNFSYPV